MCGGATDTVRAPERGGDAVQVVHADLKLQAPERADGRGIHTLVAQCAPLDLNSVYTYLLLAEHFSSTCVVARAGGCLRGFVSAFIPPRRPDVLFIWQVAVHRGSRGRGLGPRMLRHLLMRRELAGVRYIETTVTPSNESSRRMFFHVARALHAPVCESPLFDRRLFGPGGHDDEPLLRIGPFDPPMKEGKNGSENI